MLPSEFDLIDRFFKRPSRHAQITLGIGDDCALLTVPTGYELAITTDTMVENVHFLTGTDPQALGHKLLAVNLSDLSSMGARPLAATLALTLPTPNDTWLRSFCSGFFNLADRYQVDLIGGDTTEGPLTLTLQAMGMVPAGKSLQRTAARPGDLVYISGKLGDAGLGLKITTGEYTCSQSGQPVNRLLYPEPRVDLGQALPAFASACIDISDGLTADLKHILDASHRGARLDWNDLPLSPMVRQYIAASGDWTMPLRAGDDYELCFTIPADKRAVFNQEMRRLALPCSCIGVVEQQPGIRLLKDGVSSELAVQGYEHFSS